MSATQNKLLAAAIAGVEPKKRDRIFEFILNDAPLSTQPGGTAEPYVTLAQLATQLNFHPTTLWRWNVPRHELAGRPRFIVSEVVAYLQSPEFKSRARELKRSRRARSAT